MGIQPRFFYSINREISNSKINFLLLHYPAREKEEELSVYFRVDFIFFYFLVLFSGFESASCAETSRAGSLILLLLRPQPDTRSGCRAGVPPFVTVTETL